MCSRSLQTESIFKFYNIFQGCQPYPFPSCDSYGNGTKPKCPSGGYDTPKCIKACDDSKMNFEEELIYGRYPYRIYRNEEQIMTEIFTNGPVVAGFEVYNDFFHYKSGKKIDD